MQGDQLSQLRRPHERRLCIKRFEPEHRLAIRLQGFVQVTVSPSMPG